MTMSDNEWKRVVQQIRTNGNKPNRVILVFTTKKVDLVPDEFYSSFYAIFNYYILQDKSGNGWHTSSISYFVSIMQIFLHVFCYHFCCLLK